MVITGKLIRAARALAGWTQNDLGRISGVSKSTIKAIEAGQTSRLMAANERLVVDAFESAGVEFTNGDAPGVRLSFWDH